MTLLGVVDHPLAAAGAKLFIEEDKPYKVVRPGLYIGCVFKKRTKEELSRLEKRQGYRFFSCTDSTGEVVNPVLPTTVYLRPAEVSGFELASEVVVVSAHATMPLESLRVYVGFHQIMLRHWKPEGFARLLKN